LGYILVIVESPSKAKTIEKYLGKDYKVIASKGHIYDLPPKELGIDLHNNFKETLVAIKGKEDTIKYIKKMAKGADKILLAPDPDREGEAIGFHLKKAVGSSKEIARVTFNAITKEVVQHSVKNPTELNKNMYASQKTRRILDRLVGYKVSPILWDKIATGLSAGRVQSVALRIIVEREDEIKAFNPEKWFSLTATLNKGQIFESKYFGKNAKDKNVLSDKEEVEAIVKDIKDKQFKLVSSTTKDKIQSPTPPFTTSKLQQEASAKLGFSAKLTMQIAQKLYEGKSLKNHGTHGLITYMRTDSVRTDDKTLDGLREYILENYGKELLSEDKIIHKKKGSGDAKTQDAHESIRPASLKFKPDDIKDDLSEEEYKLYNLIWNKFVTSQMASAIIENTTYIFDCAGHHFKTSGNVLKFSGFKTVYDEEKKEKKSKKGEDDNEESNAELPLIIQDELVNQEKDAISKENLTSPPARYSEATLVKELEDKGVGRPSTYAAIIENIKNKKYVEHFQKRFRPTELGEVLCKMLIKYFPLTFDVKFTAKIEKELDSIEEGTEKWTEVLNNFWNGLHEKINEAYQKMPSLKPLGIPTGQECSKCELGKLTFIWKKNISFLDCDRCEYSSKAELEKIGHFKEKSLGANQKPCIKCGGIMEIKSGKYGEFWACTNYPDCKKTMPVTTGVKCPQCNKGEFVKKVSKKGNTFWGCSNFPNCKSVLWGEPVVQACVHCRHPLLYKDNRSGKLQCASAQCKKYN
jgi:DNA topoisomerase-1